MTLQDLKFKLASAQSAQSLSDRVVICRELLSDAISYIFNSVAAKVPPKATLLELIDSPTVTSYVDDRELIISLHYVRIIGMNASHGETVRRKNAKLALDNISSFIRFIEAKETGAVYSYTKPPYMSEAETRRLYVDLYLGEAGWEILDQKNVPVAGKAGIEIEVQGMPNPEGKGFCDYVLYGRDGKPLAIVEVKKTSLSPEKGRHQVDLYADCMELKYGYRPVLYYTNGYETRIIDGIYPDRSVIAFHSLTDLELIMQRRGRHALTDTTVNPTITDREYQQRAITAMCETFDSNRRSALSVMATGTGKTRFSIALVEILSRNDWIKTVLFLADRTTLVNQAKRNYEKYLPDMSVCELSGSDKKKDLNSRLMFSTYQTMINYIDAEEKIFSTGRFDLIIIDEAHRSIFNRYGTIFKYFDSLLLGLTATPKNEVDANTYDIFGCEAGVPTFDYSMEEAIQSKYLVGYKVINKTSKLMTVGAKYEDLSKEEKEQLEEYIDEIDPPTPDFTVKNNEFFKHLFNEETCKKVITDLMNEGLRVDGGETLGKTIIFAFNHHHAYMIRKCFYDLYPKAHKDMCQIVDNYVKYADDLVIKFDENPEFRIAVSVDMLDTGVDIPAVLNLVFFKRVKSKIKFIQMIGRGTRTCKDLFGPGKDKTMFLIFDYCGDFEYFGTHPDIIEGVPQMTLSMHLFHTRLDMLQELQGLTHQMDPWEKQYYETIKTELHQKVVQVKGNSKRIQVRAAMQYVDKYYDFSTWTSLSAVEIKEAKRHIGPLLDSGMEGNYLSVAFDIRMYNIELELLKAGKIKSSREDVKRVRKIAKYLLDEKASVPEVFAKAADLLRLRDDVLWKNPTVPELEKLRDSLRGLMPYLIGSGRKQYDVDISDIIDESDYPVPETWIDIRTYREKVIDYLAEHTDHEVIRKIHNIEQITAEDLKELEKILWNELGSIEEYRETTDQPNLAVFVRSLVGLSQEAVNEKFGAYLFGNKFNSKQQEFIKTIIDYVRQNGDIELSDMANTEPFKEYSAASLFGEDVTVIIDIINLLHSCVLAKVVPVAYPVVELNSYRQAAEPDDG